jgi:hypothetical protein
VGLSQIEGGQVYDAQSDMFSLGVMAAVMVCLEMPWNMDGGALLAEVRNVLHAARDV